MVFEVSNFSNTFCCDKSYVHSKLQFFFASADQDFDDDFDRFESNEENHGYIDVCYGCWRPNVLVTSLRCG